MLDFLKNFDQYCSEINPTLCLKEFSSLRLSRYINAYLSDNFDYYSIQVAKENSSVQVSSYGEVKILQYSLCDLQ